MSGPDSPAQTAAVCDKGDLRAAAMTAYLRTNEIAAAEWFAPRDVDEVDGAVCEGRIRRVVFPNLVALLDAIWDEDIRFERWLSIGVTVSFVDPPAADCTPATVFESWKKWNQRHRHRRVVAGVILSGIAVIAGFLLTLLFR